MESLLVVDMAKYNQVLDKIDVTGKFWFNLGWFSISFFSLLQKAKEIKNKPRLNDFKVKTNLTCNRDSTSLIWTARAGCLA